MTTQTAEQLADDLEQSDVPTIYRASNPAAAMLRSQAAEKASLVQQRDELLKKAVEQAQEIDALKAELKRKAQYGKEWMDKYLELRATSDAWCEAERKL